MQAGYNITTSGDPLRPITVEELYRRTVAPDTDTRALIERLRLVRTIDIKEYNLLKRRLPYVVCGVFNPPVRRTENFGYCEYFIIDIDHIKEKKLDLNVLRRKFAEDSRVVLCFASPSEDGIKLLYRLREKCYDAGRYQLFYKAFTHKFSQQYGLEQVLDRSTCDVARACFVSYDPDAVYRPNAVAVEMNDFINTHNIFEVQTLQQEVKKRMQQEPVSGSVDDEIIAKIKERLAGKQRPPREKPPVFVPEQLNTILNDLRMYLAEAGILMPKIVDIQYGKQLYLQAGSRSAAINLFFGKKGFTVVEVPKHNISYELNVLSAEMIREFIYEHGMTYEV